eukprot:maker-scaffold187_size272365-snap-gene-0.17 protein:Tk10318 transcript:maker-scaffold187_size272365-snap-gene-0.17-mRNA-1 annotation:"hypothetical protein"
MMFHQHPLLYCLLLAGLQDILANPMASHNPRLDWLHQHHLLGPSRGSDEDSGMHKPIGYGPNENLLRGLPDFSLASDLEPRPHIGLPFRSQPIGDLGGLGSLLAANHWEQPNRYFGALAKLYPKRSMEEAISEYGRVIKRSGGGNSASSTHPGSSAPNLLVSMPKTKYSDIKMPGDFRIMKRNYRLLQGNSVPIFSFLCGGLFRPLENMDMREMILNNSQFTTLDETFP